MRPGSLGRPSDDNFDDVERRIRSALQVHAETVEPSDDAFLRLTEAVAGSPPKGIGRWFRPGFVSGGASTWSPVAFVTAVIAVAVGLTVTLVLPDQESNLAAIGPATPGLSEVVPGGDDPIEEPDDEPQTGSAGVGESGRSGLIGDEEELGSPTTGVDGQGASGMATTASTLVDSTGYAPVRTANTDAVESLIDRLALAELSGLEKRVEGDRVVLVGGDGTIDVAEVDFGRVQDAFAVTELRSDAIEFKLSAVDEATDDQPEATSNGGAVQSLSDDDVERFSGEMAVEVSVDGTVESLEVQIVDALDGRSLAGFERFSGDPGTNGWSLETSLSLPGSSRVWVVASAYSPAGELLGVHAEPIRFDGVADPTEYTVVGLRRFDPDGGLVVRDAPAGDRIGVLPFGESAIARTADVAESVEGRVWWSVADVNGLTGWVAAEFLMAVPDINSAALDRWARSVLVSEPVENPPLVDPGQEPLFANRLTMGESLQPISAERRLSPERLLTSFAWDNLRNLPNHDQVSFADFYQIERWRTSELEVDAPYADGTVEREHRALFGALPSFVVPIGVDPKDGIEAELASEAADNDDDANGDGSAGGTSSETGETESAAVGLGQQVRFHVANGALPGQPALPVIVGITLEPTDGPVGGESDDASFANPQADDAESDDSQSNDSQSNDSQSNDDVGDATDVDGGDGNSSTATTEP